jgi:nitrogen fixation NifU-like protein
LDLEQARGILLDHAKRPRNHRGALPAAEMGECRNPLCGDVVQVYVTLTEDRVSECSLTVQGCTICTASASLMSEKIKNHNRAQIQQMRRELSETLIAPPESGWPTSLDDLRALAHLRVNPSRVPCALLSWYALKEALKP